VGVRCSAGEGRTSGVAATWKADGDFVEDYAALDHLVLREDNLGVDLAILATLAAAAAALVALTRGRLGYDPSTRIDLDREVEGEQRCTS
jgi:hypothetical protein